MTSDERISAKRRVGKRVDARRVGAVASGADDRAAGDRAAGVGEGSVSAQVRATLSQPAARERTWRIRDFGGHPAMAVAQALSRLARDGTIVRVSKGVYAVKGSSPLRTRVYDMRGSGSASDRVPLFPCSVTAARALYLSLQCPNREWYSTPASRAPGAIEDGFTVVVTRRPRSWYGLEPLDGALLEVLRDGCIHSQLEPLETARALRRSLLEDGRLTRIMSVAPDEPPRVRAMLGALIEHGRKRRSPEETAAIQVLRESLNPLSRYGFGQLGLLPEAPRWQARALKPLN